MEDKLKDGVKLTVVTWSMRHRNLGNMGAHMGALAGATKGLKLRWHIAFNPLRLHFNDVIKRNNGHIEVVDEMLWGVKNGWVLICSDDNLVHPRLPGRLVELVKEFPKAKAFHVGGCHKGGERRGLASELKYGHVDGGQVVFDAEYFRSFGWSYWQFFLEQEGGLFRRMKESSTEGTWVHVDEPLSYHDACA